MTLTKIIEDLPKKQEIANSATDFADYLTNKWPQLSNGRSIFLDIEPAKDCDLVVKFPELPDSIQTFPKLNYYISGSLAVMLLSQADYLTEIQENDPSQETLSRTIPQKTHELLGSFSRLIGDLDFNDTDSHKLERKWIQQLLHTDQDEYRRQRKLKLQKGGGGPSFAELTDQARKCLIQEKNQSLIMCDPVSDYASYGKNHVVKINLRGKDYYICDPRHIIAYKVLHLLQSYESKSSKFNEDFPLIIKAFEEMYEDEELTSTTFAILMEYFKTRGGEAILQNRIQELLSKKELAVETEAFLKKLIDKFLI
ncbi:MAG: hypothetical protein PHU71_04585 [Candidatus Gracilibacteria bacterium]|nr:hypothetical protein [Candidatus Gracilibacteria bacterium]